MNVMYFAHGVNVCLFNLSAYSPTFVNWFHDVLEWNFSICCLLVHTIDFPMPCLSFWEDSTIQKHVSPNWFFSEVILPCVKIDAQPNVKLNKPPLLYFDEIKFDLTHVQRHEVFYFCKTDCRLSTDPQIIH